MAVPYTFGSATTSIPLSQLDSNFATTITLGNTAVQLGNTITNLTGVSNVASATSLSLGSNGNTTAVTINTAQQVLVGTTTTPSSSAQGIVNVNSGGGFIQLGFNNSNGGGSIGAVSGGGLGFYGYTGAVGSESYSERMRINSSGNLLIGTTSASSSEKLNVTRSGAGYLQYWNNGTISTQIYQDTSATSFINSTAHPLTFNTNDQERVRIESSGFFKQRANGGSYFSGSYNTIQNNNNVSGDICLVIGNASGSATNNTSSKFLACADSAADRLFIYGNGNVVNTNNSYGGISDIKLKENIVDTSPKLADLMQVKVRNYNLIGETTRQIGVVAQELETVFPAMIDESSDRDKEGNDLGTTTKSVKYSVFVPMLIKAIQELKAINDTQAETINALTARIVALESK